VSYRFRKLALYSTVLLLLTAFAQASGQERTRQAGRLQIGRYALNIDASSQGYVSLTAGHRPELVVLNLNPAELATWVDSAQKLADIKPTAAKGETVRYDGPYLSGLMLSRSDEGPSVQLLLYLKDYESIDPIFIRMTRAQTRELLAALRKAIALAHDMSAVR
jgi:hypothetical protein